MDRTRGGIRTRQDAKLEKMLRLLVLICESNISPFPTGESLFSAPNPKWTARSLLTADYPHFSRSAPMRNGL